VSIPVKFAVELDDSEEYSGGGMLMKIPPLQSFCNKAPALNTAAISAFRSRSKGPIYHSDRLLTLVVAVLLGHKKLIINTAAAASSSSSSSSDSKIDDMTSDNRFLDTKPRNADGAVTAEHQPHRQITSSTRRSGFCTADN
jgi:hypothetical protein